MRCVECEQEVEFIDDSQLNHTNGIYTIYLECPECGYRFVKDVALGEGLSNMLVLSPMP